MQSILYEGPNWDSRVEVLSLDVCDKDSIVKAKDYVKNKYPEEPKPLYGIVNNAGVAAGLVDEEVTSENLQKCLGVNLYGLKNVTDEFIELVNDGGRIVNVTSASGPSFVNTCHEDLQKILINKNTDWSTLEKFMNDCLVDPSKFGDGDEYGISKACANLLTLQYAVKHPNLLVNACTPGFIETDLTKPYLDKSGKSANDIGMLKPKKGTVSILHCLFSETMKDDNNGVNTGLYFGSDGVRSPLHMYRGPGDDPYDGSKENEWFK